jgi:DNA-binding CsgD family transcriptional regulator
MAFHGGSLQRVRQEGDFLNTPYWLAPLPEDGLACFSGIQRLGARAYWEHRFVRQMLRPVSCGDGLLLACRDADLQMELHIFRADGDEPFDARDKRMCLFLNDQLRCYMADLAPMSKPSMMSLPPRPRQLMAYLLKGYSEKEAADHMDISPQTVHDYVKTIYRHFKVGSRAQLTALYLGLNQESGGQSALDLVENGYSVRSEKKP